MLRRVALLAAFGAAAVVSSTEDDAEWAERATLFVHKHKQSKAGDVVVAGRNMTVTYSAHNVGEIDAVNVRVEDLYAEESFDVLDGSPAADLGTIPAGEARSFTVTLLPKGSGTYQGTRALVTYEHAEKADSAKLVKRHGRSSSLGEVPILSVEAYERANSAVMRKWVTSFMLWGTAVLLPVVGWQYLKYASEKPVGAGKAGKRR